MTASNPTTPTAGPLEALRQESQSSHTSRRERPPDIHLTAAAEDRIPLKAEKVSRRESRLGLRSIFGRSPKQQQASPPGTTTDESSSPAPVAVSALSIGKHLPRSDKRVSMVDFSSLPYSPGPRPDTSVSATDLRSQMAQKKTSSSPYPDTFRKRERNTSASKPKPSTEPVSPPRDALATWDPPPLFQAYPQAIKYAILPAPVLSADAILRMHEKVSSAADAAQLAKDAAEGGPEKATEKVRKKHRREASGLAKLEWTTKVYVLCTSGYVLQYAGEGQFDRLPEKMLHLGKESAAFVGDAIPGRHWVLQVSSSMDVGDGSVTPQAQDSRSLLSRLPFRVPEKRHAANFLMVFEQAEEMESWIAALRKEIEGLGGKKGTSETGKPKPVSSATEHKTQPSQRTLVVRDPDRFSKILPSSLPWNFEEEERQRRNSGVPAAYDVEPAYTRNAPTPREASLEDLSTTNSVSSSEGRQLDNLRDSSHRFSHASLSQRTVVTSANSSPACSPIRESFNIPDQPVSIDETSSMGTPQLRPRPNAAAILDRRQSMQAMNVMDIRKDTNTPPMAETSRLSQAPNFSVPTSKRFSQSKMPAVDPLDMSKFTGDGDLGIPTKPSFARRAPPPTLPTARPLSIVADQPSPPPENKEYDRNSAAAQITRVASPLAQLAQMATPPPRGPGAEKRFSAGFAGLAGHESVAPPIPPRHPDNQGSGNRNTNKTTSPRKSVSMNMLRQRNASSTEHMPRAMRSQVFPPLPTSASSEAVGSSHAHRSKSSSVDHDQSKRSVSTPASDFKQRMNKRSTIHADQPIRTSWGYGSGHSYVPQQQQQHQTRPGLAVIVDRNEGSMPAMPIPTGRTRSRSSSRARGQPQMPDEFLRSASTSVPTKKHLMGGRAGSESQVPTQQQQDEAQAAKARAVWNRRSMPQLCEGPPPAPPPTCALPPIPQKPRQKSAS